MPQYGNDKLTLLSVVYKHELYTHTPTVDGPESADNLPQGQSLLSSSYHRGLWQCELLVHV